jgi:hypothetical protein
MKKCKHCSKSYKTVSRNKCNLNGFCSYACYRKTDDFKMKFKKTFIKNRNKTIDVEDLDRNQINDIFHKLKSESVKKSQSKRISTIRSKGENEFSRMTKLGGLNRKKRFLVSNNIVQDVGDLSHEEIDRLFLLHFNKIEKHGEKIKTGLYKKYGKELSKTFKRRYKRAFLNYLNEENLSISQLSINEYKEEINKFNKKHAYKDVIKWKKGHLKNQLNMTDYEIEQLSKDEVCNIYSQYLCDRMKLVDNIYNGYRKTKKGYYMFKNIDRKIFYRSSWEELFLKEVDTLIGEKEIDDISVPRYINYNYRKLKRKYYPDFKITFNNKYKIIEIKPFKQIDDPINKEKIKSAKKLFNKNFIVLTEKDIFSDLRNNILKIVMEKTNGY